MRRHLPGDRSRPPGSRYEAEGVTGGVGKDIAREVARSQLKNVRFRFADVLDHDVEMKLLGSLGIRPPGRSVVRGQLKRDPGGRIAGGDHHPVVAIVGDRQPQKLGVEGGKPLGVGTVDDHVVESPDHGLRCTSFVDGDELLTYPIMQPGARLDG
jgi:hypothetical protein